MVKKQKNIDFDEYEKEILEALIGSVLHKYASGFLKEAI